MLIYLCELKELLKLKGGGGINLHQFYFREGKAGYLTFSFPKVFGNVFLHCAVLLI